MDSPIIFLFLFVLSNSYLAATGLSGGDVQGNILAMADFSFDLIDGMELLKREFILLGLDISNIGIRVGFHTGPVTAGVIRGMRGTYQLFGHTVYTANRLEQTGIANCVQISPFTASFLKKSLNCYSITQRNDIVLNHDNTELCTYWLTRNLIESFEDDDDDSDKETTEEIVDEKEEEKSNGSMNDIKVYNNDKNNNIIASGSSLELGTSTLSRLFVGSSASEYEDLTTSHAAEDESPWEFLSSS